MSERKSTNFNWELFPNKGFGSIEFGLNISQLSVIENALGNLLPLYSPLSGNDEIYELLKGQFPEDEIKNLMEQMKEINADQAKTNKIQEFASSNGIRLMFEDELLTGFFADDFATNLHFQGISIFSSDPVFLIKKFSTILSEIPLVKEKEVVFLQKHIFLYDFIDENGTKTNNKERTINWRNCSRTLGVSLDDYKKLNLNP